ncbi:MAG: PE family protein, partial [Mycobacterium sp.]
MSSVIAVTELITTAATDLRNIGSTLSAANAAAAAQTMEVLAAAEDEVSEAIAAVFSAHGRGYQALLQQTAAFHEQFGAALAAASNAYAEAEATASGALGALGA